MTCSITQYTANKQIQNTCITVTNDLHYRHMDIYSYIIVSPNVFPLLGPNQSWCREHYLGGKKASKWAMYDSNTGAVVAGGNSTAHGQRVQSTSNSFGEMCTYT